MIHLRPEEDGVARAANALRDGALVVVPTETVWGVAALASHPTAVDDLVRLKERPADQPFSLMVPDVDVARTLWADGLACRRAAQLGRRFWPGSLTLVVDKSPDAVISPQVAPGDTVGVRIPDQPHLLQLLREVGAPLAVPSANLRGAPPPSTLADVQLPDVLPGGRELVVLDAAVDASSMPSSVVRVTDDDLVLFREGALTRDVLQQALS